MAGALTLRFANRSYAILKQELANLGAGDAGRGALDMMELDRPALDWVGLARGMGVEAARAETLEELERYFAAGVRSEGPYLIDLVL
jgi:acetolactate synthase-1/2/3 large subunit